jgi:threonine/homoserine/homoserine lactone efflux protein
MLRPENFLVNLLQSRLSGAMPPLFQSFLITALIIELTPGPNMVWLALLVATSGRRAGFLAVCGITTGLALIGIAAALGFAEVFAATPWVRVALRWAGTSYLLYLAWQAWRGANETNVEKPSDMRHFRRGFLINILNAKAALFYLAVLPTFIAPESAPVRQALILTLAYVLIATLIHLVIVVFADHAQIWLGETSRGKNVRRGFALMLVAIALWFFVTSG